MIALHNPRYADVALQARNKLGFLDTTELLTNRTTESGRRYSGYCVTATTGLVGLPVVG